MVVSNYFYKYSKTLHSSSQSLYLLGLFRQLLLLRIRCYSTSPAAGRFIRPLRLQNVIHHVNSEI